MTPEEAKALRKGDEVLVRHKVDEDGLTRVGNVACGGSYFSPSAIHSVLPRPLAVGDKVRHAVDPHGAHQTVLAIHGDYAWCDGETRPWSCQIANLTRV